MHKDQKDTQSNSLQITLVSSELAPDQLEEILESNKDSIFVVQQIPTPESSLFPTYMNMLEHGFDLRILTSEEELTRRYTLWVDMGSNFALEEYDFMNAFYYCALCIAERRNFQEVARNIMDNPILTQDRIKTYLKALNLAYFTIDDLSNISEYERNSQRDEIIEYFLKYDNKCLERLYQVRLINLINEKSGRNIVVIADDKHIDGIKRTNENPNYRTPLPGTANMKKQIKNLLDSKK
jgi:hypothetical protein